MTTELLSRPSRGAAVRWMDAHLYPDVPSRWDDQLLREQVLAVLRPEHELLDLGAGAGIVAETDFRAHARRVCGVDPDPRVVANPHLDEGRVGLGESIPWPDGSFDVVVADNVLEHLEHPARVFREVARVLRPGGAFVVKTPNLIHYMPTVARLTPLAFHRFVNRLRGRASIDTFPTRYRVNTVRALRRVATEAGLELVSARRHERRPEYLRFNGLTYLAGWLYERAVNSTPAMETFRIVLVAVLRRPEAPS